MASPLTGVSQDFRLALRSLSAAPTLTIAALLSLALGIGANSALFSLVNALILRPLPVEAPERLFRLSDTSESQGRDLGWTYPTWDHLRQQPGAASSFAGLAAWGLSDLTITDRAEPASSSTATAASTSAVPTPVTALMVSGDFFSTLGLAPHAGRLLRAEDDVRGGGPAGRNIVISYGLWQRRFGGNPSALGATLTIESTPLTIVGIAPRAFHGVEIGRAFDVAIPLELEPLIRGKASMVEDDMAPMWLKMFVRPLPEQSVTAATDRLRALQPAVRDASVPRLFPGLREQWMKAPFTLQPAGTGSSRLRQLYQRPLLTLSVVAALVLLVACANIANLLLARAVMRRHELGVRRALGASAWRMARQWLAESLLLATLGVAAGLLFAQWASQALLARIAESDDPIDLDRTLDWRILAFTIALTAGTALIFGAAPALRAARVSCLDALKRQGRGSTGDGRTGVSTALIIGQAALSLVLVITAGLFVRTFDRLARADLGFDGDRVLIARVNASSAAVPPAAIVPFFQRLADTAAATPGVTHAALSIVTPVSGSGWRLDVADARAQALPLKERRTSLNVITPGWLDTYGIALRAGRDFDRGRDTAGGTPALLVNEAFVRKHFPDRPALGETVTLAVAKDTLAPRTIVGIVADSVYASLRETIPPTVYMPIAQWDLPVPLPPRINVSVRAAAGSPAQLERAIDAALLTESRSLGLSFVTLPDQVRASFAQERLLAQLAGFFGLLALVLAAIGLYGVTATAVARQRRDMAIRLALGSTIDAVIGRLLRQVIWRLALGATIGVALTWWGVRFIAPLLYGFTPRDPLTITLSVIVLGATGLFAAWLPARRVARIDPAMVLQGE